MGGMKFGVKAREGETLGSLAREYGVSPEAMRRLNSDGAFDAKLSAGTLVRLPREAVDMGAMRETQIRENDGFETASPRVQDRLLGAAGRKGASLGALMAREPGFYELSDADQNRVLDLDRHLSSSGREAVQELVRSGRLFDQDTQGGTALDHLTTLSVGDRSRRFTREGVSRKEMVSSLATEMADPYSINQGSKGTCTMTSTSFELARDNPAEYGRLVAGLSSSGGEVKMANGETLAARPSYYANDSATNRSPTERILQASLMDFGNGEMDYDNAKDAHLGYLGRVDQDGGLYGRQTHRARSALFDTPHTIVGGSRASEQEVLAALQDRPPGGGITLFPAGAEDSHMVTFERIEDGRIYFRNPWGGDGNTYAGARREGPGGLESLPIGGDVAVVEAVLPETPRA